MLYGSSNHNSGQIRAFGLNGNDFVFDEGTGTNGSASGFGGSVVLAIDESGFYYGALEVDALDVRQTLRTFPQVIRAATGDIAFGDGTYYDARTTQLLGDLGFAATSYGLNPHGTDFWTFDAGQNLLRHFALDDRLFAGDFE